MRERIYSIIEPAQKGDKASLAYDVMMMIAITASIIPLMFVEDNLTFRIIETVTVTIFIIDYLLRWITCDYRIRKKELSYAIYPFTGWAIIDLLSILPGLSLLGRGFKIFRITRLVRTVRLFKFFRYSSKIRMLGDVLRKEKKILFSVLGICAFYIILTALIMFNAEPHFNPVTGEPTFRDFFDALYWATVTLTTVGYGDMVPVTDIGRFISMLSSLFGVALIALPSGIITASYLDEIRRQRQESSRKDTEEGQ